MLTQLRVSLLSKDRTRSTGSKCTPDPHSTARRVDMPRVQGGKLTIF